MDLWSRNIQEMPLPKRRQRYMELSTKIFNMEILTKDELSELIAIRESLQQIARNKE
jgi:hypothetical protein